MKSEFRTLRIMLCLFIMLTATFMAGESFAWVLQGTIYGGSNPLSGATVALQDAGTLSQLGTTTSNAGGMYSFQVSDGSYNLTILPPAGSLFAPLVVNAVAVSGMNVTQNVVMVQEAVVLSGVVRNPAGLGAKNIKITVKDQTSGTVAGTTFTDGSGNYAVPVPSGTYKMDLYGTTLPSYYADNCGANGALMFCVTNIPAPKEFRGTNVVTNLKVTASTVQDIVLPFVTLSGKVTDQNGIPVVNATLEQPSLTAGSYVVNNNWSTISPVKSDASGNYSLVVASGTGYSVTCIPPLGSALSQAIHTNIAVPADSVNDFILQPAWILSGLVRNPAGLGAKNIKITVKNQTTSAVVATAFTDANGTYALPVPSGTYKIDLYGTTVPSYYADTCGVNGALTFCVTNIPAPREFRGTSVATNLEVTASTVRDIVLPFVTLSGKTTDQNGIPTGNVTLEQPAFTVQSAQGSYLSNNSWSSISPVKSDASGNYSLVVVSGAGYTITCIPPLGSGLLQSTFSNLDLTVDSVRDFALAPALILSGVVHNTAGVGAKNIKITVKSQSTGVVAGTAFTDGNGRYAVPVQSGTYKIDLYGTTVPSMFADNCGENGALQFCVTNIPAPQEFRGSNVVTNLVVTGATVQDIALPFVTLSGKTTDGNGVPVGGVTLAQPAATVQGSAGTYVLNNSWTAVAPIKSDAAGRYRMLVVSGTGYSETIIPPAGSGFAQTVVNNIDVTGNILQDILLFMPDTVAPVILSGPTVRAISDKSAVVEWQTSEPSRGEVRYNGSVAGESAYAVMHSVPLTDLAADTDYSVSVSATDKSGNGPALSPAVSFQTKLAPDTVPPVILEGPNVSAITSTGAVVQWITNEPATGSLAYGPASPSDLSILQGTLATHHRQELTGLTASTIYYLKVSATDASGNGPTTSRVITFRSVATPDTTAPVIVEGPMAITISDSSATVVWRTDEPSTGGVSWNDGTAYGVFTDDSLGTSHSVQIKGLSQTSIYTYVVSSTDRFKNGPTLSTPKTFVTLATPDTTPPVFVESPLVVNVTHQSAVIRWSSDEPSDALIEFGTTASFGSSEARAELVSNHNIPLTGLAAGTLYYFRVSSKDAAGNGPTRSATYNFTTDAQPGNKAPVITATPVIVYSTDTSATVAFETDIPCDTVVSYGTGSSTTNSQSQGEKVNKHQATLTNLNANTAYGVSVSCTDLSGNTVVASAGKPATFMALNLAGIASDFLVNAPAVTGFMTGSQPDTTAPVITAAPTVTATTTMATVRWTTDEIGDSQVFYNLQGLPLNLSAGGIEQVSQHTVVLTNLQPGTTYQIKTATTDPSGNGPTYSGVLTFGTLKEPANGVCGSSNGAIFTAAPIASLCWVGTATDVNGSGPWNWTCVGSDGGATVPCGAMKVVTMAVPGDCDHDGQVVVSEVQNAIGMFLGINALDACVGLNGSGQVGIAQVQKVINVYIGLNGP